MKKKRPKLALILCIVLGFALLSGCASPRFSGLYRYVPGTLENIEWKVTEATDISPDLNYIEFDRKKCVLVLNGTALDDATYTLEGSSLIIYRNGEIYAAGTVEEDIIILQYFGVALEPTYVYQKEE